MSRFCPTKEEVACGGHIDLNIMRWLDVCSAADAMYNRNDNNDRREGMPF